MSAHSVAMNNAIRDSVLLEPFKDAQMVNCSNRHSFSLETIHCMFGRMQANGQCEIPGLCPLCLKKVTAYVPNPDLQSVVDMALQTSVMPFIHRKLTPQMQYPLAKSTFFFNLENKSMPRWEQGFEHQYDINDQQYNGITRFSIITYPNEQGDNGSVDFVLHFLNEESKIAMKNYLKEKIFLQDCDLIDENQQLSAFGISLAKGLMLIRLLKEHNDFSSIAADSLGKHRDYMRRLSPL